jgi:hypothetical protein
MNHDPHLSAETDDEVSAAYRAVAGESAPPHLDRQVLRQAKTAAGSRWFGKYSFSFFRPAAFVATLGLSLAIVLQISDTWLAEETNKPPLIAGAEVQRTKAVRFCEAAQSESADKWWDCIVQLELDGRDDALASERELFMRTFPDYVRR